LLKLAVLASRVSRAAKRFFGVRKFYYYALADGISMLLSRLAVCCPLCHPSPSMTAANRQRVFAST